MNKRKFGLRASGKQEVVFISKNGVSAPKEKYRKLSTSYGQPSANRQNGTIRKEEVVIRNPMPNKEKSAIADFIVNGQQESDDLADGYEGKYPELSQIFRNLSLRFAGLLTILNEANTEDKLEK